LLVSSLEHRARRLSLIELMAQSLHLDQEPGSNGQEQGDRES
jgi:hypothetical protein